MDVLINLLVSAERSHVMTQGSNFEAWRKSSLSSGGDNCVEIAFAADGTIGVRDTKQQGLGPVLEFTPGEWEAFLGGVRLGEFDQS